MILWNPQTDTCYLEAYWQLQVITVDPNRSSWNPARYEADQLREASLGLFNVPMVRKVRCLSHEVWSRQLGNMSECGHYVFIKYLESTIIMIDI